MTEVPNSILWIAAASLIIQTVLVAILLITLIVLTARVKTIVSKVGDFAEKATEVAETAAATFSKSLLRPLSILGLFQKARRSNRKR